MKVRVFAALMHSLTANLRPQLSFPQHPQQSLFFRPRKTSTGKIILIMQRDTQETVNQLSGPKCFQEQIMGFYNYSSDFKNPPKVDLLISLSPNGIFGCVKELDTNFALLFGNLKVYM